MKNNNKDSIDIGILKRQIREKDKEIKYLQDLVERDNLTKLYNRRGFLNEIKHFVSSIKKEKELNKKQIYRSFKIHNLSILFIDLDNFKKINDLYGHNVGDKVLIEFSNFLLESVRNIDIVGRWSGDEFVVGLIESSITNSSKNIKRIYKKSNLLLKERKKSYPFPNFTVGVSAIYEADRNTKWIFDTNKIIDLADKRMYKEKKLRKIKR